MVGVADCSGEMVSVGPAVEVGGVTGVLVASRGCGTSVGVGVSVGPPGVTVGRCVEVGRGVWVGVAVAVAVDVAVAVGVAVAAGAQPAVETLLLCSVTAPVCARARPFKSAPVFRVMLVSARIFPLNEVVVSRVADEATLHHTLHGSPPVTDEPGDVISVDNTDLKIQTPDPLSVKFPVSMKALAQ